MNILKLFQEILSRDKQQNSNKINDIILTADQYLRYNMIKYPTDGNVQEKLKRILFLVTNFVDKYQACNCINLSGRDMAYKRFKNDPVQKEALLSVKSNYYFNRVKFGLNKISINSSLNSHVLFKHLINDFGHLQNDLKLFWKGELKSINVILDDLEKNLFDYASISKYIKVVVEWTTGVSSYTLLDVMHHLTSDSEIETKLYDKLNKIIGIIFTYTMWPERFCIPFNAIISELYILTLNVKNPQIAGMESVLKKKLKQNEDIIQREIEYENVSFFDTKNIEKMNKKLGKMYEKADNSNSDTKVEQPLQYNLTDYFFVNIDGRN